MILDFTLADRPVHLEVAGARLFERLAPAFAHLPAQAGGRAPCLTVRAWDAAETGFPRPASRPDPGMNGTAEVSDGGRIVVYRRHGSSARLDRDASRLDVCFEAAESTTLHDRGKPLQFPIGVWHLDRGVPLVHAAVVGRNGRGLLLPGKGGSGKSTTALCCALAGFQYVGDDCVGVERTDDGRVRAHGVYGSTTLEPAQLARFPSLASHAIHGALDHETKPVVLLQSVWPERLTRVLDLAAVVVPRIVPSATSRCVATSRAEALRALAPSSMLFFPGWGAGQLDFLADVVRRLPCYRLEMGRDLDGIAPCLEPLVA